MHTASLVTLEGDGVQHTHTQSLTEKHFKVPDDTYIKVGGR